MKPHLVLLTLLFISCGNNTKLEKFNQDKWLTGTQIERGNMATNLIESKVLIGKNKTEVIKLLGTPKDSNHVNFNYQVDFGYMTPFDLNISFDNTMKVYNASLSD